MIRLAPLAVLPLLWAAPAAAQTHDMAPDMAHTQGMAHGHDAAPEPSAQSAAPAPTMPGMDMGGQDGQPDQGAPAAESPIPNTPPPPAATDHLADRYYDPAAMAAARHMMRMEMGGARFSKVMANLLEYQAGSRGGAYRWDGEAWFGGDLDRFVLRSEGAGGVGNGLETGEAQGLYSRAIGRYFDLQAGVRQDFAPQGRTYLTVGTQGLMPYWFNVNGALFLSTRGELLARAEGTYDVRLTQRLVLQPRVELNFAAQDIPRTRTGAGLSDAELGLRLRYEIRRPFAPYVGVSYERKVGRAADFARAAGEGTEATTFVVGLRAWF